MAILSLGRIPYAITHRLPDLLAHVSKSLEDYKATQGGASGTGQPPEGEAGPGDTRSPG
jgi:hypothetical protein